MRDLAVQGIELVRRILEDLGLVALFQDFDLGRRDQFRRREVAVAGVVGFLLQRLNERGGEVESISERRIASLMDVSPSFIVCDPGHRRLAYTELFRYRVLIYSGLT